MQFPFGSLGPTFVLSGEETKMTAHDQTALVIGATGGIGGEVAHALQTRGWRVRALHRDPASWWGDLPFSR